MELEKKQWVCVLMAEICIDDGYGDIYDGDTLVLGVYTDEKKLNEHIPMRMQAIKSYLEEKFKASRKGSLMIDPLASIEPAFVSDIECVPPKGERSSNMWTLRWDYRYVVGVIKLSYRRIRLDSNEENRWSEILRIINGR